MGEIEDKMELTAEEIKDMDEIFYDKQAIDKTLVVAMQYHSNVHNRISKRDKIFWDRALEWRNLDKRTLWEVDKTQRYPFIKEKEKEE